MSIQNTASPAFTLRIVSCNMSCGMKMNGFKRRHWDNTLIHMHLTCYTFRLNRQRFIAVKIKCTLIAQAESFFTLKYYMLDILKQYLQNVVNPKR